MNFWPVALVPGQSPCAMHHALLKIAASMPWSAMMPRNGTNGLGSRKVTESPAAVAMPSSVAYAES